MNKVFKRIMIPIILFIAVFGCLKNVNAQTLYRVVAGSYSMMSNAETQLKNVKAHGYNDAYIAQYNGLYRVYVGSFSSKANADSFVNSVKKNGIDCFVSVTIDTKVLYRVTAGVFNSKPDADKQLSRVKSLGYSDAYIVISGGSYTVFIGSFSTLNNAQTFAKNANQKGVSTTIQTVYTN